LQIDIEFQVTEVSGES